MDFAAEISELKAQTVAQEFQLVTWGPVCWVGRRQETAFVQHCRTQPNSWRVRRRHGTGHKKLHGNPWRF